tara:strand:+ start:314 stop:601 length:288 start_codon:yes stop_codon:yes gene_type:complete
MDGTAIAVPFLIAVNCAIFGLWDVRPLREWMYENFSLSVESMRSGRYHTMRTACEFEPGSADAPMVSWIRVRTACVSLELLQPHAPRAPWQQHAQ